MSIQKKLIAAAIKGIKPEKISSEIIKSFSEKILEGGKKYVRLQRSYDPVRKLPHDVIASIKEEGKSTETMAIERFFVYALKKCVDVPAFGGAIADRLVLAVMPAVNDFFDTHLKYVLIGLESEHLLAYSMRVEPDGTAPDGQQKFKVWQEGEAVDLAVVLPGFIERMLQTAKEQPGGIMGIVEREGLAG